MTYTVTINKGQPPSGQVNTGSMQLFIDPGMPDTLYIWQPNMVPTSCWIGGIARAIENSLPVSAGISENGALKFISLGYWLGKGCMNSNEVEALLK